MGRSLRSKNREELRVGILFLLLAFAAGSVLAQSPSPSYSPSAVRGYIAGYTGQGVPGPPAPEASAPPAPASTGVAVAFNDSFTDESRVASREGLAIFHGNVTLSGRVSNPSFEQDGEWALRATGGYAGAIQSLWSADGVRSYRLYVPAGASRTAGQGAEVVQAANFTGADELRFTYRASSHLRAHIFSVTARAVAEKTNTTLWSRTFDPADRAFFDRDSVSVLLPPGLQGLLDLVFRIETSVNSSGNETAEAGVAIDDVRLLPDSIRSRGSLTSTPVETASILSATGFLNATGEVALRVSNDNGTTWENATWGQPAWFASSGRAFRYRMELKPFFSNATGNNTSSANTLLSPEIYDVRFSLETSSGLDFAVRFPRQARTGEAVQVSAEPDGLRYFFLAQAPNGLPLNLTRNATGFSFTPTLSGTYTLDVRASPLSGTSGPTNSTFKRLTLEALPGPSPPPAARPPDIEAGGGAVTIRVYATPGAADYPVEIRYWVESGSQRLSPGVVSGKVQPGGSTEFRIGIANLQVGPGSYTFGARVATPDGAHDLKTPVTVSGIIAGTGLPMPLLAAIGGGAAAGGFALYWFFLRKRLAARKRAPGELGPAGAQASMDAAASEAALPAEAAVEPPPPFVGAPPVRLSRIAEAEMPPPPVVQAEIPDWSPPTPPPAEPEFEPPAGGLEGLLRQKESLEKELRELEGYSATLGGAKSAEEVRQALEGRREQRSKLRAALDALDAQTRALKGEGRTAVPAPAPAPRQVAPPPPPPPPAAPGPEEPPPPPDLFGGESTLQGEIDRIEAELKRKKGVRG